MEIKPTNLEFTGLKQRRLTKRIIVHHSDSPDVPASEIHRWHLGRGWAGIGYHYVVRQDGSVEQGRPIDTIGSHAGPEVNPDSIGICLTGDFTSTTPRAEQLNSLVGLIRWLQGKYGGNLTVHRHRDVNATSCPGDKFPWEELQKELNTKEEKRMPEQWKLDIMEKAKEEGLITSDHDPDEPAKVWLVLAVALNSLRGGAEK